jgi:uncharacterized protein YukE
MTTDHLNYDFVAIQTTIDAVSKELNDFNRTLGDFRNAYKKLAQAWGGKASENAEFEAGNIDKFGDETSGICKTFLDKYTQHYLLAKQNEDMIARQFT